MANRPGKPAAAKRSAVPKPPAGEDAVLVEHNRLRGLMGLAAVERPLAPNAGVSRRPPRGQRAVRELLDALYAGEGAAPPTGTIFHWWGQFSDELPAPFTLPHGGHGYAEARDLEHATRVFARLRDTVLAMKTPPAPNLKLSATREWAGISRTGNWYRWMLADERQMTVEFKPPAKLTRSERLGRIVKLR